MKQIRIGVIVASNMDNMNKFQASLLESSTSHMISREKLLMEGDDSNTSGEC